MFRKYISFLGLQDLNQVRCRTIRLFSVQNQTATSPSSLFGDPEQEAAISTPLSKSNAQLENPTNSLQFHDFFNVRNLVNVRDLFLFRAHLGHKMGMRNAFMKPYLFGCRQGIDIFDLEQTHLMLGQALNFIAHVAFREGVILFVTRHHLTMPLVERTAREIGQFSMCRAYLHNMLTDAKVFYNNVTRLPDLIVMPHSLNELVEPHPIIVGASKMLIPSVAVVDSNADPRGITFPIPGNDDSPATVRLWMALFAEAVQSGNRKRESLKSAAQKTPLITSTSSSPVGSPFESSVSSAQSSSSSKSESRESNLPLQSNQTRQDDVCDDDESASPPEIAK